MLGRTPTAKEETQAAWRAIVARKDEERCEFLRRRGFSKAETGKIIDAVLAEEGRPPESIFDFAQGITTVARDVLRGAVGGLPRSSMGWQILRSQ